MQAVLAVVHHDDQRWLGRLVGTEGSPKLAFPSGKAPDHLPLGTRVEVGLAQPGHGRPSRGGARVVAVEQVEEGLVVEVEPESPDLLADLPRSPDGAPNRRSHLRVAPPIATAPIVAVRLADGPPSSRNLSGRLLDASRGGIGLRFALAAEKRLCSAHRMRCRLYLPGDSAEVERSCVVRNRALVGGAVRYGLAFIRGENEPEPPPAYEAHWACSGCGTEDLLAETHLHCCLCGSGRGDLPTSLPDWDHLVTADAHPFMGADRSCARCGSAWAAAARNCGHCGTRLPGASAA